MSNIIGSVRLLLLKYTVIQRLVSYIIFMLVCTLFLSSVNPAVVFAFTFLVSWIIIRKLHSLTYYVPEIYIFKLLDLIDEIEFRVKRHIFRYDQFKKAPSISELVAPTKKEDSNLSEESFNTPESEASICIQYIVRDFIDSWYKEYISTENQPIEEAQEILEQLTIQTFDRLKKVDVIPFVELVILRFQQHIADYFLAQEYWKQQPYFRSKRHKDRPEFKKMEGLAPAFRKIGRFHPAMQTPETESEYLRSTMRTIMKTLFPNEAFKCDAARELLLEILAQNIINTLVDLLSDPFWLHKVMVLILTDDDVDIIDIQKHEMPNDSASVIQNTADQEEPADGASTQVQSASGDQRDSTSDSSDVSVCQEASPTFASAQQVGVVRCDNSEVTEESEPAVFTENILISTSGNNHSGDMLGTAEFQPSFFVGDGDTMSTNSADVEPIDSAQRISPEGCSPPKDLGSYTSPQFHPVNENEIDNNPESNDEATSERKELYRQRNRRWNPLDDRLMPSPLTILSDSSTYCDSIDVSEAIATENAETDVNSLKIDYGPDISNIDPAALIKETPRILFAGVHIPNTESAREPGAASHYTLYSIEYVAWHFLPTIGRWTQQPGAVKRRFREFITLQDRLQDHPVYRKHIRDVKGPTRWRVKPLGQLHEKTIENRRRFLEQYLQILTKKEDVGTSMALKEFLAYEADNRIAFVKKAPEMPRLDKIIVRTFSGVMNKIATMPGAIQEAERPTSPACLGQDGNVGSDTNTSITDVNLSACEDSDAFKIDYDLWYPEDQDDAYNNIESILWKTTYLNDSRAVHLMSECETGSTSDTEFYDPVDFTPITSPRPEGDGCDRDQLDGSIGPSGADIPLTVKILDLAVQLADRREAWVCHKNALRLFKIVIGKALDRFITQEIAELTSSSRCALYISKLKDTLWPNGDLDTTVEVPPSDKQRAHTRAQAREALFRFFPAALPIIAGVEDFNHCVDVVMNCVDNPELNRTFAFTLMDLIVEAGFPEINSAPMQQKLLSNSAGDIPS